MDVVYDLKKNAANIKKHGVDFEDAQVVLLDPFALTWEDEDAEDEQRFLQLGVDAVGRVLVVTETKKCASSPPGKPMISKGNAMKPDVYEKYKDVDFGKAKRATSVPLLNRLRTEKSRITILIDTPVLTEFRARGEAQGMGYQTLINDALRDYLGILPELNADIRKLVRQEVKAVLAEAKRPKKAA